MFEPTWDPDELVHRALRWASARGIALRHWPDATQGVPDPLVHQPTLYLVARGAEPPPPDELADWVREPAQATEVYARADNLLARAQRLGPVSLALDPDGVLYVDDRIVVLTLIEAEIMRLLVGRLAQVVTREEVLRAVWPDRPDDLHLVHRHVAALRRRLEQLPLTLHVIRGQGLLLEREALVSA